MSLMRMDGLKIPEQETVGTIVLLEQRSVHMLNKDERNPGAAHSCVQHSHIIRGSAGCCCC